MDDKNHRAKELWNQYIEIKKLKVFEQKEAFDKIKSEFLSYVISVPENIFKEGKEGINITHTWRHHINLTKILVEAYF